MKNKINFNEPFLTGNELENIKRVFKENKFYGDGVFTKNCHQKITEILGKKNILLTDSCSSALDIVALCIKDEIDTGEVIMPSYTFPSTANAFAKVGIKIVFAEIKNTNMTISIEDVLKKINRNTKAIVMVHYGSFLGDILKLKEICSKKKIILIEDAAQAFGSKLNGHSAGTFGDFGCFSFHETKNLHAGLSGALYIKKNNYFKKCQMIWERGTNRQELLKGLTDKYTWREIGGSYYPSELQASFLDSQLNFVRENISYRKKLYKKYNEFLRDLKTDGKLYFPDLPAELSSNYHSFYILTKNSHQNLLLRNFLKERKISSYIGYIPLHSSPMGTRLGNFKKDLPITNKYSERVVRLPFHNNMKLKDVKYVCSVIKEFYDGI